MEFLIPPLEMIVNSDRIIDICCPRNNLCGCDVVAGCACPRTIMEP